MVDKWKWMFPNEIIKKCADAMGIKHRFYAGMCRINDRRGGNGIKKSDLYDPSDSKSQAMDLVLSLKLEIFFQDKFWLVRWSDNETILGVNKDLLKAICECVANKADYYGD